MNPPRINEHRFAVVGDRFVDITPLTFGRARIHIGHTDTPLFYDDSW